jgi:hypothetical protein
MLSGFSVTALLINYREGNMKYGQELLDLVNYVASLKGVGLASLCLCIAIASLADSIHFFMKRKRKKQPEEKNVYSILD